MHSREEKSTEAALHDDDGFPLTEGKRLPRLSSFPSFLELGAESRAVHATCFPRPFNGTKSAVEGGRNHARLTKIGDYGIVEFGSRELYGRFDLA